MPEEAAAGRKAADRAAGHIRGLYSQPVSAEVPDNPMTAARSMTRSTITVRNTTQKRTGRLIFPWRTIWTTNLPCLPAGLDPLMVRLVLPKDGVRRSPRETEMPRAGNPVSREVPPLIRTGPEQHRPFQEIRGAPQKGSRILWKGAGHLPDGSRDKWQNDVKKADGRGFFCSFWLHS